MRIINLVSLTLTAMEFMEIPEQRHLAEKFYEDIGLFAKTSGITISVISIKGSEAGFIFQFLLHL